jgi:hypothetical protein
VVANEALDVRLVEHVLEPILADPVLYYSRLILVPWVAREILLHTDIIYQFIISRTSNECVVLAKRCDEDSPITPS